jgi:hypothetical protein
MPIKSNVILNIPSIPMHTENLKLENLGNELFKYCEKGLEQHLHFHTHKFNNWNFPPILLDVFLYLHIFAQKEEDE